jgi:KamA family protein
MRPQPPKLIVFDARNFMEIPQLKLLPSHILKEMEVVASVLPFRVNQFVIEELINWNNVPNDPIFQMVFPQKGMLKASHFQYLSNLINNTSTSKEEFARAIHNIQMELNPNPSKQISNIPMLDGRPLEGVQHKYKETVLLFPPQGQTCHSHCTFCFRWSQFVGNEEFKFATRDMNNLFTYLKNQKEVTDVLITGGDPMVMNTKYLISYLEPLLHADFDHIKNIRIGTKAITYWPYRFTHGKEADNLLNFFEKLIYKNKHVAIMANCCHVNELAPDISQLAIKRILKTGAVIRGHSPVLRHVNDDAAAWSALWNKQVCLGIIPYYMFVERDTGAHNYFELPLIKCLEIYNEAVKNISGLCKTVRGPIMSAAPGKVEILGVQEINKEKVFLLRFIQARNTEWLNKPFFAKYDASATWFDQLKPSFNDKLFFFQDKNNQQQHATAVPL